MDLIGSRNLIYRDVSPVALYLPEEETIETKTWSRLPYTVTGGPHQYK
ncbi:uncharacterized protein G2W53_012750 [Senna tora]|uniref:Uncharacterized protein n=1 Tax=Senna tora TaxID=362788 RepID=A0A834TY37_9FABA|nr:uncharacterized protein G2W53_012750 [Senna tora]